LTGDELDESIALDYQDGENDDFHNPLLDA
jgi:hypothetical protein